MTSSRFKNLRPEYFLQIGVVLLVAWTTAACTPSPLPSPAETAAPSPAATLPPAASPTPAPTAFPTAAAPPSPTPTPIALPVGEENAGGLQPVLYAGDGTLDSVQVSPDGSRLAVAGSRGVWLVDKFSLSIQDHLSLHAGAVYETAWSPDGTGLASAGQDGTVRIWRLDTGSPRQVALLVGHSGPVRAVSWSPDGQRIASGGEDQTIRIWQTATFQNSRSFTHTSEIYALDWHPDSQKLMIGEFDGSISVSNALTGVTLSSFFAHDGWINSVRWSPDGTSAATGGLDGVLRIWDAAEQRSGTLEMQERLGIVTGFAINRITWSPDGERIAAAGGTPYVARVYDPSPLLDEETLRTFEISFDGHTSSISGLAYAPGNTLITTSADNTLRVWSLASGMELRRFSHESGSFTGPLTAVDWAPGGDQVATGGADGSLRFWDATTGEAEGSVQAHTGGITDLDWSPGGRWIATGGNDNHTRIWDAAAGDLIQELRSEGGRVNAVAFSPSGDRIAAGGFFRIVQVWQAGTDQPPLLLYPDVEITALGWSSSGTLLAVGGSDGTVRLYDVPSGSEISVLSQEHSTPISALAWEPLGGRLAAMDRRGTIALWETATGEALGRLAGQGGLWSGLSWAPQGVLAAGSDNGTVLLLDAVFLQPIALHAGHGAAVSDVQFNTAGSALASAASDGGLAIWQVLRGPDQDPAPPPPLEPGSQGSVPESRWPPAGLLTPETAAEAEQLAIIGRGTAFVYDGNRSVFAASGGTGTWIYAFSDRLPLRYLESGRTYGLAFSPEGSRLATRELQLVRIWDVENAAVQRAIPAGLGLRNALAWSPDGSLLAFPDRQGNVAVHNTVSGQSILGWSTGAEVRSLAWSRDGRLLAAAAGTDIWLWDIPSGKQIALLAGHEGTVTHLVFHPDSSQLLSAGEDSVLRIWELDDLSPPETPAEGEEIAWPDVASDTIQVAEFEPVTALAWPGEGNEYYSAHGGHTVFEWGAATREIQDSFGTEAIGETPGLVLLPDGSVTSALGPLDGHFEEQNIVRWLDAGPEQPANLVFLGEVERLRMMNLSEFRLERLFEAANEEGAVLNLLADGPLVYFRHLTVGPDPLSEIRAYVKDTPDWLRWVLDAGSSDEDPSNWIAAVSPDGLRLAWNDTRSDPQTIALRDLGTNLVSTLVELSGEAASGVPLAADLAWSPDGNLLAAGLRDGSLSLWGGTDGLLRLQVALYEQQVNAIAWSPDGRLIAAAGSDGSAGGGSQFIRLLQVSNGQVISELPLEFAHTALVVAFSPDGRLLASGDSTGDAQIWDVETGERLADLKGHKLSVTGIAFSADGAALATSSRDGTVRVWGLAPEAPE